jgi:actin-related protein 2
MVYKSITECDLSI